MSGSNNASDVHNIACSPRRSLGGGLIFQNGKIKFSLSPQERLPSFNLSSRATLLDKLEFSGLLRREKLLCQKTEAFRQMLDLVHRSALLGSRHGEVQFSASYLGLPSMLPDADKILLDHFPVVRRAS